MKFPVRMAWHSKTALILSNWIGRTDNWTDGRTDGLDSASEGDCRESQKEKGRAGNINAIYVHATLPPERRKEDACIQQSCRGETRKQSVPFRESEWKQMLYAGVMFTILGLLILPLSIGAYKDAEASVNWPTVPGQVQHSYIHDGAWIGRTTGSRTHYQPNVEYTYSIAGVDYTSDQVSFTEHSGSTDRSWAEDIVTRYPAGAEVTVYYKPTDHGFAVLDPGIDPDNHAMILIAIICLVGGPAALFYSWWSYNRPKREAAAASDRGERGHVVGERTTPGGTEPDRYQ